MNIDLANVPPVPIQIGVAGENAFRTITFDASTWGADFPDATYTVVYKRSDGYIYPVLVNAAADATVWSPTDTDTAVSGNGQIEVRLLDGETIGKTIVMQTFVAPSLSGDESEPSTPAPDWVNDVAADADRAEDAVSHYPKIVNGVWFVWNAETGEFVSTGISAQGEDGVSPTVTVETITGGHRVTITDASGDHEFDVMDGEDASGAADAVLYTPMSLTPAQQEQARENIGIESMTAAEIEYICRSADDNSRSASPTYAEVVGKWDRLQESYPNNITKEIIGQDSGGNNIWAYTVRSHTDTALDWCKPMTANRKILWLSGIHGHEITVPYDDFVFFSDLVRHHGENLTLQWLWDHVTFVVVPVICPWGLDNGSRVNANGVNLNRNFPASNWAISGAGTNDYSGAAAGSEPETQALMALINAHKDALFAVNRHTMNAFSPTARYAYISSLIQTDRQAASEAFKALDGICKTNFDVFADLGLARNLFAVCDSTVTGTLDQWYNEQGVHGFLLEMSPYFNASHFPNADAILAQNINATVIGNFLFGFTQEPEAFSDELPTLVWEAGVVSSRGDNLSNNYRIRTKDAVQLPAGTVVTIDNGYQYKVNTYSRWTSPTDFAMVENGSFMTDSFRVTGGSLYYRFSVASVSGGERVADDVPGTAAHLHMEIIESELAAVAYSGSYNDLSNKPTIPSLAGYATETWVQNQGYQTSAQVQTAINGVRQLPAVSTTDNGKFLRVVSGAWAAETVQTWQGGSY